MDMLMDRREKKNKDKHGKHCYKKRTKFSPFVLFVHGMLGKEALVILDSLSQLMAEKMDEPISHVRIWFNG